MKEIGVVLKTSGKDAVVMIKRHAACGDCGACQVGKEKMTMETRAENAAGAKVGDEVTVEMEFSGVIKATSIAYGIPLIAFLIGCALGYPIAQTAGWDMVLTPFFCGIIMTVLAFLGIRLADRRGRFNSKYRPVVTEIIDAEFGAGA